MVEIEENGFDSWLALTEYHKIDLATADELTAINNSDKFKAVLTINLKDIKCIELYYDKNTQVI